MAQSRSSNERAFKKLVENFRDTIDTSLRQSSIISEGNFRQQTTAITNTLTSGFSQLNTATESLSVTFTKSIGDLQKILIAQAALPKAQMPAEEQQSNFRSSTRVRSERAVEDDKDVVEASLEQLSDFFGEDLAQTAATLREVSDQSGRDFNETIGESVSINSKLADALLEAASGIRGVSEGRNGESDETLFAGTEDLTAALSENQLIFDEGFASIADAGMGIENVITNLQDDLCDDLSKILGFMTKSEKKTLAAKETERETKRGRLTFEGRLLAAFGSLKDIKKTLGKTINSKIGIIGMLGLVGGLAAGAVTVFFTRMQTIALGFFRGIRLPTLDGLVAKFKVFVGPKGPIGKFFLGIRNAFTAEGAIGRPIANFVTTVRSFFGKLRIGNIGKITEIIKQGIGFFKLSGFGSKLTKVMTPLFNLFKLGKGLIKFIGGRFLAPVLSIVTGIQEFLQGGDLTAIVSQMTSTLISIATFGLFDGKALKAGLTSAITKTKAAVTDLIVDGFTFNNLANLFGGFAGIVNTFTNAFILGTSKIIGFFAGLLGFDELTQTLKIFAENFDLNEILAKTGRRLRQAFEDALDFLPDGLRAALGLSKKVSDPQDNITGVTKENALLQSQIDKLTRLKDVLKDESLSIEQRKLAENQVESITRNIQLQADPEMIALLGAIQTLKANEQNIAPDQFAQQLADLKSSVATRLDTLNQQPIVNNEAELNKTIGALKTKIGAPGLADGGIVSPGLGGTFANIGEGGESEAIIPLSRLSGLVIVPVIDRLAEVIQQMLNSTTDRAVSDRQAKTVTIAPITQNQVTQGGSGTPNLAPLVPVSEVRNQESSLRRFHNSRQSSTFV